MAAGRIDAIALTNLGQIRCLIEVARARGCEDRLREGLEHTPITSVGPAVSDKLKSHGLRTDIYPAEDTFFMRPCSADDSELDLDQRRRSSGKSPSGGAGASRHYRQPSFADLAPRA